MAFWAREILAVAKTKYERNVQSEAP